MDDLVRKIGAVARAESANRVVAVTVRLGPLSHFTADHFREHFEWAAADTIADGAEVRFEDWAPLPGADDTGVVLADVEIGTQ
jgi:Zn finger protein HypA/HybF involved in hydrogenase expression